VVGAEKRRAAEGIRRISDVPDGTIFLRDIRLHDDHSQLTPQSFCTHYMPVTIRDLRRGKYSPQPWTPPQKRFASARQTVRLGKGRPGSGKTSALWHTAEFGGRRAVIDDRSTQNLSVMPRL
jgi:hypothetical protein